MTRITGTAVASSHGAPASTCTFCASCSRMPQLIAGGRRPSPRKLSEVSLTIITGKARLTAAMMWLANDGSM
jgi:hypothetical protein